MRKLFTLFALLVFMVAVFASQPQLTYIQNENGSESATTGDMGTAISSSSTSTSNHQVVENGAGKNTVVASNTSSTTIEVSPTAVSMGGQAVGTTSTTTAVQVSTATSTVEIKGDKEKNTVTISSTSTTSSAVPTATAVSVSVASGESVEVSKGGVYLKGMNTPLKVYPSDIISPTVASSGTVTAILTTEDGKYKYEIRPGMAGGQAIAIDSFTSTPIVIASGTYTVEFPYESKKMYVDNTVVEQVDMATPVAVSVKENDAPKEIQVTQQGTYLTITDAGTSTKATTDISVDKQVLYAGGKEVKVLPATASARAFEVTGATVKEVELKTQDNKPVYVMGLEKDYNFLWLIPVKATVPTTVSAEDGTVLNVEQPWWSAISSGGVTLKAGDKIQ
ncbi:MAG: hypothetical protein V1492_04125 [Candidatus Micrarchaeota archaeon]